MEAIQDAIKALILPELKIIAADVAATKVEQARIAVQLDATNHRLNDMHDNFVLMTQRQDALGAKMDAMRSDVDSKLAELRRELDDLRRDMNARLDRLHARTDELVRTTVRRDDIVGLRRRVKRVERQIEELRHASGA